MATNLLTVTEIKNAKLPPGKKEASLSDGGGLFVRLRLRSDGSIQKTFIFRLNDLRHTIGDADARTLGGNGSITLQQARVESARLRPIRKGDNPLAAKREAERAELEAQERLRLEDLERVRLAEAAAQAQAHAERLEAEAMSMDRLFEAWDASHGTTLDTHWRAVRRSHWRCHISPIVGSEKIQAADKQAILQHYDKMVREGKEETGRRALALLKQVIAWGVERQHVLDDHPLTRLIIPKKQRVIRADQLPENFDIQSYLSVRGNEAVGDDLEDSLAGRALQFSELVTLLSDLLPKSTQALTGRHLMRLMLATGIRSSEAVRLRWQWIDIDRRLMIIPAGSMKKRKMHHIHLSEYAVRQLDAMEAIRTGDFVFPAPRKENDHILRTNVGNDISSRQFYRAPDESLTKFEARLAKRMQCRRAKQDYDLYNLPGGKWTLYDLRRTVATRMEELGVERDMVARVLAHARPDAKTTGRYARHTHWEQRCKTLDLLGNALEHCESGQLPLVEGGNVVQLKRA